MDGSRFDQLARTYASHVSRRIVLKSIAGLVASGAIGLIKGRSVNAALLCRPNNTVCLKNGDCCNGLCGSKDFTGRQRCGCTTAADCPLPSICQVATCSGRTCGTSPNVNKIGQVCGTPASCNANTNTARTADLCDAAGACITGQSTSCGYYVCGATACLTTCSTDNDCVAGAHCDDDSVCRADHDNGVACEGPGDCVSGHCVDGVCCNDEFTDPCFRCDTAAAGICSASTGTTCSGGTCVAGSCCPADQVCGSGLSAVCGCGSDTCCDGICTPLGTKSHCSSCADACVGNSDCCDGQCEALGTVERCLDCDDTCTGTTPGCCAGGCADLDVANNNCGSCGNDCSGKGYDEGVCCSGECFDLFNDIDHCGSCNAATCTGGIPDCCAGTCLDLATDLLNCGACFKHCSTDDFPHSTAVTCSGGACLITACDAVTTLIDNACCLNERVCGSGASMICCQSSESCCSGVCADTSVSTDHCGFCNHSCPAGVSCAGGNCAQGSFGDPCSAAVPCSYTNSSTGNSCLNGFCCIPSQVACTLGAITFSGQCCSSTSLTCPSVDTCS